MACFCGPSRLRRRRARDVSGTRRGYGRSFGLAGVNGIGLWLGRAQVYSPGAAGRSVTGQGDGRLQSLSAGKRPGRLGGEALALCCRLPPRPTGTDAQKNRAAETTGGRCHSGAVVPPIAQSVPSAWPRNINHIALFWLSFCAGLKWSLPKLQCQPGFLSPPRVVSPLVAALARTNKNAEPCWTWSLSTPVSCARFGPASLVSGWSNAVGDSRPHRSRPVANDAWIGVVVVASIPAAGRIQAIRGPSIGRVYETICVACPSPRCTDETESGGRAALGSFALRAASKQESVALPFDGAPPLVLRAHGDLFKVCRYGGGLQGAVYRRSS